MNVSENTFKRALAAGRRQLGAFLALGDAHAAELMASAGFDWLLIDCEHGPNDLPSVLAQLQALAGYAVQAVLRPADHDAARIKQYLDLGVQSLLAPMVDSAAQAQALVAAMRYPPRGIRGVGAGMARAARWGGVAGYYAQAEAELCLAVQVETLAGLDNLDAIAAVEGVDGVFLGPADLAAALGHLGEPMHADVRAVVQQALPRIRAAGKAAGVYCADPDVAAGYAALGASFFLVAADAILLRTAAAAALGRFAS
ncbi:MAG: HpcH/HpaI aldolase/citrate lyase family protein [Immundisolibacter sp.]|uniref:HpcH/HpaI aldolase family protein n=1 Tax=Immundisolibacter sp. TaxID=1934948 RepID=UPI0019BB7F81|nr:HpcH/HpaI aldolase/citrate lyase family protein [Immundisolibacter sp.]MBC7161682.1 HpcH/HpaI aldolase/citrate lyase family protein [Immundisolibacter sp.]